MWLGPITCNGNWGIWGQSYANHTWFKLEWLWWIFCWCEKIPLDDSFANCLLILDCSMALCCTCNGRNAIYKRCVCTHSGRPYISCLPLKTDHCVNQPRAGKTSASVSGDPLMVGSNKNDDGSDGTAHMLPGTNCASDPRYVLDTSNTCTNVDSLPFLYLFPFSFS